MKTLLIILLCVVAMQGMAQTTSDPNNSLLGLSPANEHAHTLLWDTTTHSRYAVIPSTLKPVRYVFFNTPSEIMSISAPDSTRTITVKFSRKQVTFINDSTFTFKLK